MTVVLFATPSKGLELTVDTEIPDFILDDTILLSGTTTNPDRIHLDTTDSDFLGGEFSNLSIMDNSITFEPQLEIEMLNEGEPVLEGGPAGSWDSHLWDNYDIVIVEVLFYLYYTGSRSTSLRDPRHIGLATSPDGVNWTKHPANPLLISRNQSYDHTNLMAPVVIDVDSTWHMWYGGNHGNTDSYPRQDIDICYATSSDGVEWTKYQNNPVIENGWAEWNNIDLRPFDVLEDDGMFVLYYRAIGDSQGHRPFLARALSIDGMAWLQDPDNPLHHGDGAASRPRPGGGAMGGRAA